MFQPDPDGAVFAEPWQAEAFALAVRLSDQGCFTWTEWAAALAEQIQADSAGNPHDAGSRYYLCWLAALENLVVAKGLAEVEALQACKQEWARAYERTPHGMPVELHPPPAN